MATVYHELGSRVTVVELLNSLIPGADKDIVKPLHKRIEKQYENIFLGTKVTSMAASNDGIKVTIEGKNAPGEDTFHQVLVAVGRRPNGKRIGAENAGVDVNERGFIPVDKQMRTNRSRFWRSRSTSRTPRLATIPNSAKCARIELIRLLRSRIIDQSISKCMSGGIFERWFLDKGKWPHRPLSRRSCRQ